MPYVHTLRFRDDVAFFQAVAAVLAKRASGQPEAPGYAVENLGVICQPKRWSKLSTPVNNLFELRYSTVSGAVRRERTPGTLLRARFSARLGF
jgi:hypothetical protein